MFTNFWVVLNRMNNQTAVAAGGPLPWNQVDPAGQAQRVSIKAEVIDAADVTARNGTYEFARTDKEWRVDLSTAGGAQMQRGRAHARGWVTVIDPPGGAPVQWDQDVWVN